MSRIRPPKTAFSGPMESAPRVKITNRMKSDVLDRYRRVVNGRSEFYCPSCGDIFETGDTIEFNHITPVFLGGRNTVANLEPLHPECHRKITNEQMAEFAKTRSVSEQTGRKGKVQDLKRRFQL